LHSQWLVDAQRFIQDGLACGLRGMNVDDEISGLLDDLVAELDGKAEANHGVLLALGGVVGNCGKE
jgi:hypothetical protein